MHDVDGMDPNRQRRTPGTRVGRAYCLVSANELLRLSQVLGDRGLGKSGFDREASLRSKIPLGLGPTGNNTRSILLLIKPADPYAGI